MWNWLKRKPGSLTYAEAEHILGVVGAALEQDDGLAYHPISSLQGYNVFQVDTALKLIVANDFLIFSATEQLDEFEKRCNEWGSIPTLVVTLFVPDAGRDKLRGLAMGSPEYQ